MEVEVVFPQICGAFYKATIVDLQVEEQKALLSFEDNWKTDSWAELDHIRFLPDIPTSSFIQPGSKVEALLPHQDNEPPGWWNGTLLKSKGELHVVEFQSGNEKYQDIVDQDKIRPPNNKEPLSKCQFVSREYSVPEDLQSFCDKPAIHENFRKRIGAVCVHYSMDKGSLVVQASSEESMDKASLLIDMHLRDLRTHKQLMDRADAVAQREHQQQRRQLDSGVYEQQIHVVSDLVGLAIGRDGHNVNEVRKLDGILSVEFEDYNQMFRVRAKTPEVLTKAKELLEIVRKTVMIPKNLAGRVIGKRGHVIQEILEKSGVNNIRVLGDDESSSKESASSSSESSPSSEVPFDFIGRKAAVENAVLMLEYHLDHLKNLETILQSREFDAQSTDEPPTYYPAPHRPFRRGGRRGGEERGRGVESWGGRGGEERGRAGESWGGRRGGVESWGGRGGEERGRGGESWGGRGVERWGEERGRGVEQWGGRGGEERGNWGGRGNWGEREGGGRGGGRWRERGRDFGRKRDEEERHTSESGYADHTHSSAPTQDTVAAGNEDEIYQSSEESNSVEEEEEEEVEQRNGQDHSDGEKSPPESEEQGPDRRRQQGPPRQQQRGGGGGGGGRGRGRGGYSRGRWRGRGGRGRGGGGGYRSSRPQQQSQNREEGVAAASTDWGSEETTRTDGDATATGQGPAPKPQRSERGRGRNRNPATSNNTTANSASAGDSHTPVTTEP